MIRRIQALDYRCLRYADVRLDRFHVLVGPNASGKSTVFYVVAFLGDLVRDDLEAAIGKRTRNFPDPPEARETILLGGGKPGSRTILSKSRQGADHPILRGWRESVDMNVLVATGVIG